MSRTLLATAHKLARLVYRLLKHGEDYVAQGMAEYKQTYRERTNAGDKLRQIA